MELTNDRNALIDKVTIYDFTVTEIDDIAKLQKSGNLVVKDGSDYYIYTESGKKYSCCNSFGKGQSRYHC